MNDEDISTTAAKFQKIYSDDIEPEFVPEIVDFKNFVGQFDEFRDKHETPQASDIYTLVLKQNGLTSSFPNVEIALRIYLCLMITNATGERSFSRLKHIKNVLGSTMTQERLNGLPVMEQMVVGS